MFLGNYKQSGRPPAAPTSPAGPEPEPTGAGSQVLGGPGGPGPNWRRVPGRGGEGTRSCRGVPPSGQGDRGAVDSSRHTRAEAGGPLSPPDRGARGERMEQTSLVLKPRLSNPRTDSDGNYQQVTPSPGAATSETWAPPRHRAPTRREARPPPHPPQRTEASTASPAHTQRGRRTVGVPRDVASKAPARDPRQAARTPTDPKT